MTLAKKILGVVGIIFGAIGVLLAILAIAASWTVNKPVTDVALDLLDKGEAALVTVDNVLERTDNGL